MSIGPVGETMDLRKDSGIGLAKVVLPIQLVTILHETNVA